MPGTENYILSTLLTLFILSLITEKVVEFLKLYFPSWFARPAVGIETQSPEEERARARRDRRIYLSSFLIGSLVAALCNADFFALLRQKGQIEPLTSLDRLGPWSILGYGITGLFLSGGSKFFHDLLDMLLYTKNMRRTLVDKAELETALLENQKVWTADRLLYEVQNADRDDNPDNHL